MQGWLCSQEARQRKHVCEVAATGGAVLLMCASVKSLVVQAVCVAGGSSTAHVKCHLPMGSASREHCMVAAWVQVLRRNPPCVHGQIR